MMGLVVDDVKGVVTLQPDEISPAPGNDYLIGLGESDGRRLVLLDIDKLMAIQPSSQRKLGSMLSIQHR